MTLSIADVTWREADDDADCVGGVTVGSVGMDGWSEQLEKLAKECAESFGNAWLSVNPRR